MRVPNEREVEVDERNLPEKQMVILNNILYLSFADLLGLGFTENYLFKVTSQYRAGEISSYANIPDPTDARKKLIQYTSIPSKAITEKSIPSEAQLCRPSR
jgi:hypothetical protein